MLAGALATVLVVGELAIGGVWDLLRIPYARETVTRLFADFKKNGLLQVKGSTLVIKDKGGLESLVAGFVE